MQEFPNDLNSMAKCPICEKKYKKANATVLEANQRKNTVHFTCEACQMSSLVFISQGQSGTIGVGVLTDLDKLEVKKMFQKESVSIDQVLEIHNFFRKL